MNISADQQNRNASLISDAVDCADASAAAYNPSVNDAANSFLIQSSLAHCLIRVLGNRVIFAWRGTANIRDFITDAEAKKRRTDTGAGMIHSGVYEATRSIIDKVCIRADLAVKSGNKIFLGGHSLGGGEAVECARTFVLHGIPFEHLHTFGQMRVYDAAGAAFCQKQFGDRHTRWTNGADIVPWVPWLLGTYVHSGAEKYFRFLGDEPITNPATYAKLLYNGPELFCDWRLGKDALLADHAIEKYQAHVQYLWKLHRAASELCAETGRSA